MNTQHSSAPVHTINAQGYVDYMLGVQVERPLLVELFGLLPQAEAEWRAQGASPAELDLSAFGFDSVPVHWVWVNTGLIPLAEPQTLSEDAGQITSIDRYGRRVQLCKAAGTIPLPLDHPVANMDDWLKIKLHYQYDDSRLAPGWDDAARRARAEGALTILGIPGGFDEPRQLMGEEMLCMAYYDQPELIHDMLDTIGATCERIIDRVTRVVPIDNLFIHEDLAGKSGPLVGPEQIRDFLRPYYRRCWDLVSSRGTRLFSQDSDGNMNPVLDAFIDCGVNIFFPMEPAAGMDMVAARQRLGPTIAYKGGVDKHVLRQGREAIRRELEYKLQPLMRQHGVVFGLDHRIPNGTPLSDYRYYVDTAREILGLPPASPRPFVRMAF